MDNGKYILRSLRYIARMVVLLGIVFAVMALFGVLDTGGTSLFRALFASNNGLLLVGVLIILAGIYPRLSFAEVQVPGDIHADRQKIKDVMTQYGYVLSKEGEYGMTFHSGKLSKRILSQFDDTVTVTGAAGRLYVEGMKKDVFRLQLRLRNALPDNEE